MSDSHFRDETIPTIQIFLNKHGMEEYAGDLVSTFLHSKQFGCANFAMLPLLRDTGDWLRSAEMGERTGERDMDMSRAMDRRLVGYRAMGWCCSVLRALQWGRMEVAG